MAQREELRRCKCYKGPPLGNMVLEYCGCRTTPLNDDLWNMSMMRWRDHDGYLQRHCGSLQVHQQQPHHQGLQPHLQLQDGRSSEDRQSTCPMPCWANFGSHNLQVDCCFLTGLDHQERDRWSPVWWKPCGSTMSLPNHDIHCRRLGLQIGCLCRHRHRPPR